MKPSEPISEGFDFLGQNVCKYADKLLITPARKSVKALPEKVREVVNGNKAAIQANLNLNPIIRGWPCISAISLLPPASHGSTTRFGESYGAGLCAGMP